MDSHNLSRRDFLKKLQVAAVACSSCRALCGPLLAEASEFKPIISVGGIEKYKSPGVWDTFSSDGFLLINSGQKLFALSNTCPHKRGKVVFDNDSQRIKCTKHKGVFALDGSRISGPPDSPLSYFSIFLRPGDLIEVDKSNSQEFSLTPEKMNRYFIQIP